jgi:hypothetical protein
MGAAAKGEIPDAAWAVWPAAHAAVSEVPLARGAREREVVERVDSRVSTPQLDLELCRKRPVVQVHEVGPEIPDPLPCRLLLAERRVCDPGREVGPDPVMREGGAVAAVDLGGQETREVRLGAADEPGVPVDVQDPHARSTASK